MAIKSKLAALVGKTSQFALKILGRNGESYPGVLALRFDPNILKELAKDYTIILITGTNGKTLTTALSVTLLKERYPHILTNPSGSNMIQGIISAFLSHKVPKNQEKIAVLEVDEAYLVKIASFLKPKVIVTTNLFRDQMDRFGEIYTVYNKILEGIRLYPDTTVIANGDAPIFNSVDFPNPKIYFGFNHEAESDMRAHYNTDNILCPKCEKILHYKLISYSNLGKYYCKNCDFQRPKLDYAVTSIDELSLESSSFHIDDIPFKINVAGLYNIYNALASYSVAKCMGLSTDEIQKGFSKAHRVFGRQELLDIKDKKVLINLIKNPVGLNQVIDLITIKNEPCSLIVLLNDNYADGRDVSWIWDGQFEKLKELDIKKIDVGGLRKEEMAFRLEVAGFNRENMSLLEEMSEIIKTIEGAPTNQVHILATYTAMLQLRKELSQNGHVKGDIS